MNKDRRKEIRRDTDHILRQVVCVLQIPDKISRGEEVDDTEAYDELAEMKDRLGRRQEVCVRHERPCPSKEEC